MISTTEPYGCAHCGIPDRLHYWQWKSGTGWHKWAQPTNAQILARMKARRNGRKK